MFTRLFNTIRETIVRGPNNKHQSGEHSSSSSECSTSRRPSVTEELQNNNDTHNMFSTSQSLSANRIGRNNSISVSQPIRINETAIAANNERRRRRRNSTLFGISNVTADDYVQKDLISSSWS